MECQERSEFVTAMSCRSVILTSMLSARRLCVTWLTSSRTTWAMGSHGTIRLADKGYVITVARVFALDMDEATVRDLHANEISALPNG